MQHGEKIGDLNAALKLPCGVVLKNRLAKSAMTENLSNGASQATVAHENLYGAWAQSGAGLIISGNVQVDRRYLEEAGNVAIDGVQSKEALDALRRWAKAGTQNNTQLWMQIGHAGRQTFTHINAKPVGPSDIKSPDRGSRKIGVPRPLEPQEIRDVIARFAFVAATARDVGFTGVQLHGAHGYLISAFLSPKANQRQDEWGGPLENRARLLLETIRAVRKKVGDDYPVAIKLNSSDFLEGGFTHAECLRLVGWLNEEKLDLIELSGGSYESPAMAGIAVTDPSTQTSTNAGENYFLDYARNIVNVAEMPIMVTGGFRDRQAMSTALATGALDVIGLARPFGAGPQAIADLLAGKAQKIRAIENETPTPLFSHFWCMAQIQRMSRGEPVDPALGLEEAQKTVLDFMRDVQARYQYPEGVRPG